MPNAYKLADLRAGLDKQFAPYPVELDDGDTVIMRNLLRCSDEDRDAVFEALTKIERSQADQEDGEMDPAQVRELSAAVMLVLRRVAANDKGAKLVASIEGDLMLGMAILEGWSEATQPGEAQNSPA